MDNMENNLNWLKMAVTGALPPEFDLTAMGLPDVPMDGTTVEVKCDTTELMTALSKGPVWYSANYTAQGATFRATGMSSQVASNGAYQFTNINYFGGVIFSGVVIVVDGQIEAFCKPITMG